MGGTKRIIIAEDHRLFREGIRALLESNADFEIVGEAENGMEAVARCAALQPAIVLMDIRMPGGHSQRPKTQSRSHDSGSVHAEDGRDFGDQRN